jgi:hypothetical protein
LSSHPAGTQARPQETRPIDLKKITASLVAR